jgi:hypothetical protein
MKSSQQIAREARIESIARMVIVGQTMKQAAETLSVHYNTVRLDAKTPLFRETLERIREESRKKAEEVLTEAVVDIVAELRRGAEKAAQVMTSTLLHSQNENIVLKAASNLLDRDERTSKRRKMTVENKVYQLFTPQDLVVMAQTAKEIQEDLLPNKEQLRIAEDVVIDTSALQDSDDWD